MLGSLWGKATKVVNENVSLDKIGDALNKAGEKIASTHMMDKLGDLVD